MKKTAVSLTLMFVLVIFFLFNVGAFADFMATDTLPMNMLLFGAGLLAIASRLRRD